jgi:pimeloyl-ACP methyl ester carboxylesterase
VLASITVRALVLAALLEAFGDERSLGRRFVFAVRLYGGAAVLLLPAAGLEFAGLAAVYAWYAWAGLALTLLVALRVMPRAAGGGRPLAPVLAIAGLTALGALAEAGGGVTPVALIPVSAVFTVYVLRKKPKRTQGVSPVVATVALAATLLVGATPSSSSPIASDTTLLLVPGVDTSSGQGALYRFQPINIGLGCERVFYYSYLGPGREAPPGEAACPLQLHAPYKKSDTQRPLAQLVDAFVRQVARIRAATDGAPIAVVTHSQGAVIAWAAVASGAAEGVTHLVSVAGFPHSPVGYPPSGSDGEGLVGADVLRLLSAASRGLSEGTFSPDAPLAREILAEADGLEAIFSRPLPPGVTAATVSTSFDVIVAPEGLTISGRPGWTVDATHVDVLDSSEMYAAVASVLRDQPPPRTSLLGRVLDVIVHAFMPPPAGV